MSTTLIGMATALVLALLAAIHVSWAVRGGAGWASVPSRPDGTPLFQPGTLASLLVAGGLSVAALIVLGRAELTPAYGGRTLNRAGTWVLALLFALRTVGEFHYVGLFKTVTGTPFARLDTILFTPLCAVLALALLFLARS